MQNCKCKNEMMSSQMPLVLDRSCLVDKMKELGPLIDDIQWINKSNRAFREYWSYKVSGCKKHQQDIRQRIEQNTEFVQHIKSKRAASFLKLLTQKKEPIVKKLPSKNISVQAAINTIYGEFTKCFQSPLKANLKDKRRKLGELPQTAWQSATDEAISRLSKTRNPYDVALIKDQLKAIEHLQAINKPAQYSPRFTKPQKIYEASSKKAIKTEYTPVVKIRSHNKYKPKLISELSEKELEQFHAKHSEPTNVKFENIPIIKYKAKTIIKEPYKPIVGKHKMLAKIKSHDSFLKYAKQRLEKRKSKPSLKYRSTGLPIYMTEKFQNITRRWKQKRDSQLVTAEQPKELPKKLLENEKKGDKSIKPKDSPVKKELQTEEKPQIGDELPDLLGTKLWNKLITNMKKKRKANSVQEDRKKRQLKESDADGNSKKSSSSLKSSKSVIMKNFYGNNENNLTEEIETPKSRSSKHKVQRKRKTMQSQASNRSRKLSQASNRSRELSQASNNSKELSQTSYRSIKRSQTSNRNRISQVMLKDMTKWESLFGKKSSNLIEKLDYRSGNENGKLFQLNSREKEVIYNNPYRRSLDFQHLLDSPKKAKKYAKGNLISQASIISQGTYVPNSHKPIYDWKLKQNEELAVQEAKPEPEAQPIPEPEPKPQPKRKRPKKTKTPKKKVEHPSTYINKEPSSPPPSETELTTDNAFNTYYLEPEPISSSRGKKCSDCAICKQLRARPSKTMEHSYMNQMLRQRKKIELRHYYKQMMLRKCQLDKKLQAQRELENLLHPC